MTDRNHIPDWTELYPSDKEEEQYEEYDDTDDVIDDDLLDKWEEEQCGIY